MSDNNYQQTQLQKRKFSKFVKQRQTIHGIHWQPLEAHKQMKLLNRTIDQLEQVQDKQNEDYKVMNNGHQSIGGQQNNDKSISKNANQNHLNNFQGQNKMNQTVTEFYAKNQSQDTLEKEGLEINQDINNVDITIDSNLERRLVSTSHMKSRVQNQQRQKSLLLLQKEYLGQGSLLLKKAPNLGQNLNLSNTQTKLNSTSTGFFKQTQASSSIYLNQTGSQQDWKKFSNTRSNKTIEQSENLYGLNETMNYDANLRAFPQYYNPVGPGQYNQSQTNIGKQTIANKFKNSPSFGFGIQNLQMRRNSTNENIKSNSNSILNKTIENLRQQMNSTQQVIGYFDSRSQSVIKNSEKKLDFLYPKIESIRSKSPIAKIGTQKRSDAFPVKLEQASMPSSCLGNTSTFNSKATFSQKNIAWQRELRYFQRDAINMKNVPGVGEYTLSQMERPFTQASQMFRTNPTATFPKDQRGEIKIYNHEYETEYSNKIGPGPAGYDPMTSSKYLKQKLQCQFPKAQRSLSKSVNKIPGPGTYDTDLTLYKKSRIVDAPKCIIPKAYKKFDIIKYGSISEEIIQKGFY